MSKVKDIFKMGIAAIVAIVAIMLFIMAGNIWETNDVKNYQVKQAFYSGTMSIRKEGGTYQQNFGMITTYNKGGMYYFCWRVDMWIDLIP